MLRLANLQRQHNAAAQIVDEIRTSIAAAGDRVQAEQAYALTLLIAKLTGLMRVHFASEDKHYYPEVIGSDDAVASEIAASFFREMGDMQAVLEKFASQWRAKGTIQDNWLEFRTDAASVLHRLMTRIRREEAELYPLSQPAGTRAPGNRGPGGSTTG